MFPSLFAGSLKNIIMSTLQNSNLIAAAVGATIGVVSVATVFIYNKIMERKQKLVIYSDLDRVNRKVAELQLELQELRAQQLNLQKNRKKKIVKRQIFSNENTFTGIEEVDIDTFSTAGTDIGDDEFFDCSDDELDALDMDNKTAETTLNEDLVLLEIDRESEDTFLRLSVYDKLKNLLMENPNNIEIVWRYARACYYCSLAASNHEKQNEFIFEGCEVCKKLLHTRHGNLYKWYAILVGLKSKHLPTKGKIEHGYLFNEYIEKALEIIPQDSLLHHLLGRFKYEVSELSWIERKIAETLFAEVPRATYEDAISYFEAAEKLASKPHYENKLLLGKSYIAVGKEKEAVAYFNQINELHANSQEDIEVQKEARKFLEKYSEDCT